MLRKNIGFKIPDDYFRGIRNVQRNKVPVTVRIQRISFDRYFYITWNIDKGNIFWSSRIAVVNHMNSFIRLRQKYIMTGKGHSARGGNGQRGQAFYLLPEFGQRFIDRRIDRIGLGY